MKTKKELESDIKNCDITIKELEELLHKTEVELSEYKRDKYNIQCEIHKLKLNECKKYFDFENDIKDFVEGRAEIIFENREDLDNFYNALNVLNAYSAASGSDSTSIGYDGKLFVKFNSQNYPSSTVERIIRYVPFDKKYNE